MTAHLVLLRGINVGKSNRLATADGSKFFVTLFDGQPNQAFIDELRQRDWAHDRPMFTEHAAWAACPNGISQSKLFDLDWQGIASGAVTTRNWNTLTKLLAMMPA